MTDLISVILPTYNRANHVERSIASVVAQTYPHWELIIVDDGSQDETFAVVKPWITSSHAMVYVYQPNQGAGLARNTGLRLARGNYIAFIDSDDQYLPEHLESRWQWLSSHPQVDLIQGGLVTEEDVWVMDYYQPEKLINLRDCVVGPTFFGKRQVFEQLGGFRNLAYGEDTDLWERASALFCTETVATPATYLYTRAANSTTRQWLPGSRPVQLPENAQRE
ncbi:MAG: glycosyltransferase family A protein [Synechococcales cyanobacterium]